MFSRVDLYIWIPIIVLSILIIGLLAPNFYNPVIKLLNSFIVVLRKKIVGFKLFNLGEVEALSKTIEAAGYSYDPVQNIFYSNLNAWQRNQGYCRLYDETAAALGMIIDCEPIYFKYAGKRWLIEFWKGQYDMCTGCEIGVYATNGPDLNIPGIFNGTFYYSVSDTDRLNLSFSLIKNNQVLFSRSDRHWWLTGFRLGQFSEPSELTMNINITLKDSEMLKAFINGLKKAGYLDSEFKVKSNTVSLKFGKPHTHQPITRIKDTDWLIQRKNKLLCDEYNSITGSYNNFDDKVNAVKIQNPEMYEKIINIGKPKQLFEEHDKIKNYL